MANHHRYCSEGLLKKPDISYSKLLAMQKNILVDFKINNNQLNQLLSVLGFILWVIRLSINLILNVHFRWGLSGVFLLVFVFDIIENVWGFNITWDISNYVLFRFMLWMINHYIFKFTCAKIVGKCKKKINMKVLR